MNEFEIKAGDTVAGHEVLEVGEIYVKVNGKLVCSICKKEKEELLAVKEAGKGYCIKCFFDNRKKIYKKGQDYISLAFIRN